MRARIEWGANLGANLGVAAKLALPGHAGNRPPLVCHCGYGLWVRLSKRPPGGRLNNRRYAPDGWKCQHCGETWLCGYPVSREWPDALVSLTLLYRLGRMLGKRPYLSVKAVPLEGHTVFWKAIPMLELRVGKARTIIGPLSYLPCQFAKAVDHMKLLVAKKAKGSRGLRRQLKEMP